jgi:hypothetical protein
VPGPLVAAPLRREDRPFDWAVGHRDSDGSRAGVYRGPTATATETDRPVPYDATVTDQPQPDAGAAGERQPGERLPGERKPGEQPPPEHRRRLERPPGERYARATSAPGTAGVTRAVAIATLIGLGGATLMVVLAGQVAVSSGLLVVAALMGRFIGLALRTARGRITPARARALALAIALVAIGLAQLGIWLYARSEGGVLGLTDYLGETFGVLVPLELAVGAVIAALSAD